MNCDDIREQFPDALAAGAETPQPLEFQAHLAGCAACREEWASLSGMWRRFSALPQEKPGPGAEIRFRAMLEAFRQGENKSSWLHSAREWLDRLRLSRPAFQWAAAAVIFGAGLFLGAQYSPRGAGRIAKAEPQTPAGPSIAEMQAELANLRQVAALALLSQPSAAERLQGIYTSSEIHELGREVMTALLRAVEGDSNVNVRLAAIGALRQFSSDGAVRAGLLRSLENQESPIVQVELINLMVELGEKDSVPILQRLSDNADLNPVVRERAAWGVEELG